MQKFAEFTGYDPIQEVPNSFTGLVIDSTTGELFFPNPEATKSIHAFNRTLHGMEAVFYDQNLLTHGYENPERTVHRIYRTIGDTPEIVDSGLKYDITVILPGDWGEQLPTTTGHYHLPLENSKMASPDFYQLLCGEGLALLQKEESGKTEVCLLQPKVGEWVLFPPQYAHSIINIGKTPTVFANICVRQPHLNYKPILSRHGMAYYVLRDGSSGFRFEPNPHYEDNVYCHDATSNLTLPILSDILKNTSFWKLITTRIGDLAFLTHPDNFPEVFNPDPILSIK